MSLITVPVAAVEPIEISVEAANRAEDVRNHLVALQKTVSKSFLEMGRYMLEVKEKKHYRNWNYASLEEFCHKELDYGGRQVRTFVRVYQRFVLDLNVKEDTLLSVGSTKLAALSEVVTSSNMSQLFEYARNNNVRDVENKVAVLLGNDGLRQIEEEHDKPTNWSAPVIPGIKDVFNQAIESAKREVGSDRVQDAMEAMAASWLSGHGNGQLPTVSFMLTELQHEAWEDTLTEGRKSGLETVGAFVMDMARAWRKDRGLPELIYDEMAADGRE